jgi:iron complex transport system permease protein
VLLPILLAGVMIVSAGLGAVRVSPGDVVRSVLSAVGFDTAPENKLRLIVLHIRLPRIVAAALVGAALAASGAAVQGLFRNPMASPEIIGISAGGSLGAVVAIHLGLFAFSVYFLPLLTATGAMGTAFGIYALSSSRGRTSLLFVILAGMALSSFLNGIISLVLLFSKEYEVGQFLFWTMGGLDGRRWEHIGIVLPIIVPGVVLLSVMGREINLFLYGEESAHSLGMNVERKKKLILLVAAVLTGSAVAISGTIGFVGLLVPHLLRFLVGSDNRTLVPASALAGGVFLVLCDTVGRTIIPPYEIRVGIITAILGAPYFISLILRYQRKGYHGIFR